MDEAEKRKLFSQVVSQYSEKLYWTIRRIVLYHDDANDVLQNALIKAVSYTHLTLPTKA